MKRSSNDLAGIFLSFLKLGCVAFGGPVAHLGYFRDEYVRKRKWLTESQYADLVALCQFLPGSDSNQMGFAIGYRMGCVAGAFLAWVGFTLPSAVLMIGFAVGLSTLGDPGGAGWIAVCNRPKCKLRRTIPISKREITALRKLGLLLQNNSAL